MKSKILGLPLSCWGRLALVLSLWAGVVSSSQASASVDYLAYGELRGHLEPCGCDPLTDLGGIRRLGLVLARERGLRPGLVLFDLGNDLPATGEPDLKTPYLLRASAQLKPAAVLLNQLELERLDSIEAVRLKTPQELPPYVISNYLPARARPLAAKDVLSNKGWVALGYTYVAAMKDRLQRFGPPLLKTWQGLLAYVPAGQRVLLFSGPSEDLQAIVQAKLFDVIISANTSPMATVIGSEEKAAPQRLVRLTTPPVMMVPLGGQGLLRGGELQFAEAKPIADLLKAQGPQTKPAEASWLRPSTLVTWLTPEPDEAKGPLETVYQSYSEATKVAFRGQKAQRLREFQTTSFAGETACRSCHPEAAKVYAKSHHAQAFHTLQTKGKQEDAECVACHVVGAKVPGGFVSLEESPDLANVQCENCHGTRLAHSKNPSVKTAGPDPKAVCVGCHNAQHSPKFNFATYWPKIQHGKER